MARKSEPTVAALEAQIAAVQADREAGRPIVVTDDTFEALLIASARQAAAIAEGGAQPARQHMRERTARRTVVIPVRRFTAEQVRSVRESLDASQAVFAGVLGVSPGLVRAWELGDREPFGAAARLLEIAASRPQNIREFMQPKTGAAGAPATRKAAVTTPSVGTRRAVGTAPHTSRRAVTKADAKKSARRK